MEKAGEAYRINLPRMSPSIKAAIRYTTDGMLAVGESDMDICVLGGVDDTVSDTAILRKRASSF